MDSFHSHHLDRVGSEPLFALYGPCEAEDSTIVPATGSERSRASTGAPVGNRDAWKHGRHSLGPRALESAAAQHGTCVASLLHGIAVRQPECPESHGKPRNKRQHAISRLENGQQLKNGGFPGKIMVAEEGSIDHFNHLISMSISEMIPPHTPIDTPKSGLFDEPIQGPDEPIPSFNCDAI